MLKFSIKGINLTLPADIKITLIMENAFFLADRIPTPYLLNFDIPASPENLVALNYPNRTASFKPKEEPCSISFDNIEFSSGIMKVIAFDKNIKVSYKGVSTFDDLTKKLYDLELERYEFGLASATGSGKNKWNINRNQAGNFAANYRQHSNNSATNSKFVMAPIRVRSGSWVSIEKTVTLTLPSPSSFSIDLQMPTNSADEMYINFYNQKDFDFNITEGLAIYSLTNTNLSDKINTRAFPFPYIKYLFDVMFDGKLSNNPFSEGELAQLVLITVYHPKYYKISGYFQDDEFQGMLFDNAAGQTYASSFVPYYKLSSFMPDLQVNSLLKDVLKTFCMSLYPDGNKFKVVRNKDIINSTLVQSWEPFLMGKIKLGLRDKLNYKFGYDGIDDVAVEVKPENKVATIKDLIDKQLDESTGYTADFYVTSTGEYYTKDTNDGEFSFVRKNSGYGKSEEKSGDSFDASSALAPLPMTIDEYWIQINSDAKQKPNRSFWYVPEFSGERMTRPNNAFIMFNRGIKPGIVANRQYPLLTAGDHDHFGNKTGNLSLAWSGDSGLITQFHKEYKEWVERDRITASGLFNLSARDLKMLDLTKKIFLQGRHFLIEKLQVTLSIDKIEPAAVDLVEV